MPLGLENCFHSARNLPSWSNIWILLLPRSPTNSRPLESNASVCGISNCPTSDPCPPHCLINFPSFANFITRALPRPTLWPSEIKMSPLGAIATASGASKSSGLSPATPGLPKVIRIFPSWLTLKTWRPLPSTAPRGGTPSQIQSAPSLSITMQCGKTNIPAPNDFSSLPEASNSMIGSSFDPSHEFTPHRSATHICPFGATKTELVDPMVRPSGSVYQCSTVRYGLGWELGWAHTTRAASAVKTNRRACSMTGELYSRQRVAAGAQNFDGPGRVAVYANRLRVSRTREAYSLRGGFL